MYTSVFVISCVLLSVIVVTDTARILAVFPTPSISHQVVFRPVMLELAKRGHEVVVITTDPIFAKGKAPANYTEVDVHDMSYNYWKKFVEASTGKSNDLYEHLKIAMDQLLFIFEKQVEVPDVQKILRDKNQKFDLLFVEACVRPALALSHVFKIPTILFSSFGGLPGMYESVGAPTHILYYPLAIRQKIRELTIQEKISEYYSYYSIEKLFFDLEEKEHRALKRIFGTDVPTINKLRNNIDMVFLNINPLWDFNRPVPPNVIYLGGLHQNTRKDLPKDLKSYLDSSTNGVIYMSLGTNVKPSMLPRKTVKIFLKVFASLPYNVLWKWDQDELEGRPKNVRISKWFPQSDLLYHPNIKLFITQGGLQSTDEAITAGVPLLGIPMLGDQWYNTEMYKVYEIGDALDAEQLTEEKLLNAINKVLKDDRYRKNIVNLKALMRDQPQSSLERAVWWTEYVLRHGGAKHLRSPAANISWAEYLELELVAIVLVTLSALIVILVIATKYSWRFLVSPVKSKMKTG